MSKMNPVPQAAVLSRRGLLKCGAWAGAGVLWFAFGAQPWELLPFRDERVVAPVIDAVTRGVGDYYGVVLPFDPTRRPEMLVFSVRVLATRHLRDDVESHRPPVSGPVWFATSADGAGADVSDCLHAEINDNETSSAKQRIERCRISFEISPFDS